MIGGITFKMCIYVVLAYDDGGDIVKIIGMKDQDNYGEVYRDLLEDKDVSFCEIEQVEIVDANNELELG